MEKAISTANIKITDQTISVYLVRQATFEFMQALAEVQTMSCGI